MMMMTTPNGNDSHLEALLASHLEALHSAPDAAHRLQLQTADRNARDLMLLAEQLDGALMPLTPSPEFIERLKGEFITQGPPSLLGRWRNLRPRYQTVAKVGGATLTAGLMLYAARRAWSQRSRDPVVVEVQA